MAGIPEGEVAHAAAVFHDPRRASFGSFYGGGVEEEVQSAFTAASSARAGGRLQLLQDDQDGHNGYDDDDDDDDEVTSPSTSVARAVLQVSAADSQLQPFSNQPFASSAGLRHRGTLGHLSHRSNSNGSISGSREGPLMGTHSGVMLPLRHSVDSAQLWSGSQQQQAVQPTHLVGRTGSGGYYSLQTSQASSEAGSIGAAAAITGLPADAAEFWDTGPGSPRGVDASLAGLNGGQDVLRGPASRRVSRVVGAWQPPQPQLLLLLLQVSVKAALA